MLPVFLRRILKIEPDAQQDTHAASARNLCDMVPACPVCSSSLAGHSFGTLAEAGNKEDMRVLLAAFEAQEWERLSHIHSFEGSKNAICANAVACPVGVGFTLAFISYVELYAHDELARSQALDEAGWSSLLCAFPNLDWHAISHPPGPKARNIPA